MTKCLHCNNDTTNPKFCSRSCAAKYTNSTSPKRKLTRTCAECDNLVMSHRHNHCEYHWNEIKRGKYKRKTLGEYRNLPSVSGKHPSWVNAHIRQFARSWLKHLTEEPCRRCGYNKHVELAHIKGITEFSDDALLSEGNSEDNVLPLCPNCHWEFDNEPRENFWRDWQDSNLHTPITRLTTV